MTLVFSIFLLVWTRKQEAFNSSVKRDEDISDFERDFHKSLGKSSKLLPVFINFYRIWTCAERLGVRCTTSKGREATPANGKVLVYFIEIFELPTLIIFQQFDNDAARATKVLRREKSLKSEEKKAWSLVDS